MSTAKTIFGPRPVPSGWRKLRLRVRLRRGDKFFDSDRWIVTAWPPGTVLNTRLRHANGDYIRRG